MTDLSTLSAADLIQRLQGVREKLSDWSGMVDQEFSYSLEHSEAISREASDCEQVILEVERRLRLTVGVD